MSLMSAKATVAAITVGGAAYYSLRSYSEAIAMENARVEAEASGVFAILDGVLAG